MRGSQHTVTSQWLNQSVSLKCFNIASVEIVSLLRSSPASANMKPLPQQTQPRPRLETLVMFLIDCVKCETFFILVISKCFLLRSELADQTSCMFTFQNKVHSNAESTLHDGHRLFSVFHHVWTKCRSGSPLRRSPWFHQTSCCHLCFERLDGWVSLQEPWQNSQLLLLVRVQDLSGVRLCAVFKTNPFWTQCCHPLVGWWCGWLFVSRWMINKLVAPPPDCNDKNLNS